MIAQLASLAVQISSSPELSLLAKATLILLAALAATAISRRARASVRHLVVATSFAALIVLPVFLLMPPFSVDVPIAAAAAGNAAAMVEAPIRGGQPSPAAIESDTTPANTPLPAWSIGQWLRVTWLAGAIVFLIPVAAVLWRLSMIRRTGIPIAWHRHELSRLADARGVSLPIELLEHEAVPGPFTFGLARPVIVLPPDAREWNEAELRRALMHEIEHIHRGDWVMHILARAIAALYWFHPLVWSAWRRLCLEAERSCDDAVVISEERSDYAEQLVTLAQRMSATPVQPLLGMANRSDLSTRVTAVLDDRVHRGRAGLALAAGTITAAAAVVLSVAPVRAVAIIEPAQAVAEPQDDRIVIKMREVSQAREAREEREVRRKPRAIDRALYEAASEGDIDSVKELLAAGANASAAVEGDGSPLMGAARSGRDDIARLLLDHGADPNGIVPGDGSALIAAAAHGRMNLVQMLLERGADVNLAVDGDENPLMNAAEGGHLGIVQLLVARGADIHARIYTERSRGTGEWRTALSQARKNGHADVVKYLQSLGAVE